MFAALYYTKKESNLTNTVMANDTTFTVPSESHETLEALEPSTTPTTTQDEASYELNEPFEIEFNARPGAERAVMVRHVLRRPTLDELYAREMKTAYRTRDAGQDEEEVLPSSGDSNTYLYDKIIQQVSGGYNKEKFIDFTKLEDRNERANALKRIPATHKNDVISAIYAFESEIEYSEEELDNFIWGEGETYTVKTEVGLDPSKADWTIRHELREPTEKELLDFNRDRARVMIERGTKRPVSKIMTNLSAAVKLYDSLVQKVDGATFDGQPIDVSNPRHLKAIDAVMKQSVVSALIKSVQLDLGK